MIEIMIIIIMIITTMLHSLTQSHDQLMIVGGTCGM